jgi:hypothetical protein
VSPSRAAALAALFVATTCRAGEDGARWYVRIDNDVVFHTDRWYSAGERVARVKDGLELAIAQEIYTPEAKHLSATLQDRAPAGRLYFSAAKHWRSAATFDTVEAQLGVRGPSALGEQVEQAAHGLVPAPQVVWERQLPDAFDGTLIAARTVALGAGFRGHVGAVAGTQVSFAHAGAEWRFGDAATASSALLRFAATPPFAQGATGWSAYAGASARGILRNELLSKNYYTFGPDLEKKNVVTRLATGVAWNARWGAATFDIAQDSREFEGQRTPHRFGSLAIDFAF